MGALALDSRPWTQPSSRAKGSVASTYSQGLTSAPMKVTPGLRCHSGTGSGRKTLSGSEWILVPLIPARQPDDFSELVGQVELVSRLQARVTCPDNAARAGGRDRTRPARDSGRQSRSRRRTASPGTATLSPCNPVQMRARRGGIRGSRLGSWRSSNFAVTMTERERSCADRSIGMVRLSLVSTCMLAADPATL